MILLEIPEGQRHQCSQWVDHLNVIKLWSGCKKEEVQLCIFTAIIALIDLLRVDQGLKYIWHPYGWVLPWIPWKRCYCLPRIKGRQHNSRELNLFSPRMLLGASLVQQNGRLQDREEDTQYMSRRRRKTTRFGQKFASLWNDLGNYLK